MMLGLFDLIITSATAQIPLFFWMYALAGNITYAVFSIELITWLITKQGARKAGGVIGTWILVVAVNYVIGFILFILQIFGVLSVDIWILSLAMFVFFLVLTTYFAWDSGRNIPDLARRISNSESAGIRRRH